MKVSFIKPHPYLSPYIDVFWIFESAVGVPSNDSRIIVPDGQAKIIIPYKNPLSVVVEGSPVYTQERQIFLIGIQNNPRIICSPNSDTGTIGIELTPKGLYRFFNLSMDEITDRIYSFEDLFGVWGASLQNRLGDMQDPRVVIRLLEKVLSDLLAENAKDFTLLDRTVDIITQSHGLIRIQDLAVQMGYSRRYLDMLFKERLGISPKSFASILRFQNIYQPWAKENATRFLDDLYTYYYDQAHFIKEFKRFTGHTPHQYAELGTEFGRAFYQS